MKHEYNKKNIVIKCGSDIFLPLAGIFGCYVVLHGNGFQGGVLISSALLLVVLGYGVPKMRKVFNSPKLFGTEIIAETVYIVIALLGVFTGLNFCMNFVFAGHELETSILMNDAVGYHVQAGITCLIILMLSVLDVDEDSGEETSEEKEGLE